MAGTTMAELQELGAWKSGEMVRRYARFAPEQLRAAANRLATFSYTPPKSPTPKPSKLLSKWPPDLGSNQGSADQQSDRSLLGKPRQPGLAPPHFATRELKAFETASTGVNTPTPSIVVP
jgi:hypothetical protein